MGAAIGGMACLYWVPLAFRSLAMGTYGLSYGDLWSLLYLGWCHDSSRVSAMPTNRAYGTCYAMHTNMPTHGLHGPHAVIIMDLDVHGHALYKYRHDTLQPPMVA